MITKGLWMWEPMNDHDINNVLQDFFGWGECDFCHKPLGNFYHVKIDDNGNKLLFHNECLTPKFQNDNK